MRCNMMFTVFGDPKTKSITNESEVLLLVRSGTRSFFGTLSCLIWPLPPPAPPALFIRQPKSHQCPRRVRSDAPTPPCLCRGARTLAQHRVMKVSELHGERGPPRRAAQWAAGGLAGRRVGKKIRIGSDKAAGVAQEGVPPSLGRAFGNSERPLIAGVVARGRPTLKSHGRPAAS